MSGFLRRYVYVSIASLVVAGFITTQIADAAPTTTGTVLTTSPVAVDLSAIPGTTTTTTLQVQNNATKAVVINVKLEEFKVAGTTGQADIYVPPASDPSTSWVKFSTTSILAQPGVWNQVTMTINLPTTAELGYYYAVLFAPQSVTSGVSGAVNNIKGANAILVLLDTHSKNEQRQLQVKSFTSIRKLYQFLPATFNITVHNSGNIHIVPSGDVYISRTANGSNIATLPVNDGGGNILPVSDRDFQVTWSDGFPAYVTKRINGQVVDDKHGKPVQQLQWNLNQITKIRFGRYYAHLFLVYNDGSRQIPVSSVVSFWVIPWLFLGIVVVILALIALGMFTIGRLVYKRLNAIKRRSK